MCFPDLMTNGMFNFNFANDRITIHFPFLPCTDTDIKAQGWKRIVLYSITYAYGIPDWSCNCIAPSSPSNIRIASPLGLWSAEYSRRISLFCGGIPLTIAIAITLSTRRAIEVWRRIQNISPDPVGYRGYMLYRKKDSFV